MRKTSAALAVLSFAAVALTGCAVSAPSTYDGQACSRGDASSGVDDLVTVTGDFGAEPEVEMFTPITVEETGYTDLIAGEGTALSAPSQVAVVDVALYSGTTGEKIVATEFDGDLSRLTNINSWQAQIPGIAETLECATPGTRMLTALGAEGLGATAQQQFGLSEDESVIAVIDVLKTYLPHAVGTLKVNDANGLPTVARAADGRPGIMVPDKDAPTELVTQVLIEGEGKAITAEDPVRVHYTGVLWDNNEVFDSSWDGNPAMFDLASVVPGFAQGLEGQKVGSQVLIVIPPELGYGEEGQGTTIPSNATLVFVVDILGIDVLPEGQ